METWLLTLAFFFCMATIIMKSLIFSRKLHNKKLKLPPGPSFFSSHMLLLTNSLPELQFIIRDLKSIYGPLIALSIGSHRSVFVGSRSLANQLLMQKGTISSDRPQTHHLPGISTASYGPTWRLLRHNLASTFLNPSHVKSYSWARMHALGIMINQLQKQQQDLGTVKVIDHIQLALLRLSVLMCFGQKLDDHRINEIASVLNGLLSLTGSLSFNVFVASPWLANTLFRNKWNDFHQLRDEQNKLLVSLIESRTDDIRRSESSKTAYIDTLVRLHLPNDGRELTRKEIVSLCGEFLVAGTEATSNALQWIMANLVKHPRIQSKLYDEIVAVVGPRGIGHESVIKEGELQKIPYLRAVVLEGLRRHPPGHLVLPHMVNEDVELHGYMIPKGSSINFMVAEMGRDPEVWDEPMEFRPERFLSNDDDGGGGFDIGIKMMPFGAGRRMCPGADLALLHLEYFVANLIWYFDWSVGDGCDVDVTEEVKFTVVMKNPLRAKIYSRTKTTTLYQLIRTSSTLLGL